MILARGVVLTDTGAPVEGALVRVSHFQPKVHTDDFRATVVTDAEGRFELWVPNLPLTVEIDPRGNLPSRTETNFLFPAGEIFPFTLTGIEVAGRLLSVDRSGFIDGLAVEFSTNVRRLDGQEERTRSNGILDDLGRFTVLLPQMGAYRVRLRNCCDPWIDVGWPDSVLVASRDSIFLENPVVFYQVELSLGGAPLPLGESSHLWLKTRFQGSYDNEIRMTAKGDGEQRIFQLAGVRGANTLEISPEDDASAVIPQAYPLPSLGGGEFLALELGLYRLAIRVVDPLGNPVPGARITIRGDTLDDSSKKIVDIDGWCLYRANPGGFRIVCSEGGYYTTIRNVQITGDTEMNLVLTPLPAPGAP